MKIVKKNNVCQITFASLTEGDVFRDTNSDTIWMKTEIIWLMNYSSRNAVNLSNGEIAWFSDSKSIIPVRMHAVMEE